MHNSHSTQRHSHQARPAPPTRLPPAAAAALLPNRNPPRCCCQRSSSTPDLNNAAGDPLDALRAWVGAAGGYIDPRLTVSDAAPVSGCRGVVAVAPITLGDLDATGPLISVPQALQFTSSTARSIIAAAAGPPAAAAAAEQLSDTQLIAAALAHELHHAASSSWRPYLASLPPSPPNPWLLTSTEQILAALQPYQQQHLSSAADASDWVAATAAARQQQLAAAAEVEAFLGSALGVSQQDVLSALGQVTSRSLVSGSSSGMCPVIDLVNHHAGASAPMLQLSDADVLMMTVLPLRQGEAVPMAAGDELLILYKGGYTPLEAFLKFGFVADEWWQQ